MSLRYKLSDREKMVVKANQLIQKSKFTLSIQQQKIIAYVISQIKPTDDDFKLYEFNIKDFCNVCGIESNNGRIYENLKQHIKELSDKSIWIKLDNGKETLFRWIEKPYINENSGIIQIRIDSDMKPYLIKLTENYTMYEIAFTLNFNSKYSFRLYEYMKSIHYKKLNEYIHRIDIDELKERIGAENYTNFKDFNNRALKIAIKEINEYSDITLDYNCIYKGRKVIAIELIVKSKTTMERLELYDRKRSKEND